MASPLVSLIITTKGSEDTLSNLLESIKKQTFHNIEIIVVDNRSPDKTKEVAKKFTKLIFDKGPERSAQRNFGAKKASGEYLLFLDSDMVLTQDVVKKCIEKFKNKRLKTKIGGVVIPEKSFGVGVWVKAKILEREINKGESFFESARFFPKDVFWEFKGYDEMITGPEDWDLPQRIRKSYKIVRANSLILHNEKKLSLETLYKKKYYYGLSTHKYLEKHKLPIISATTIYFLRPAFYKRWRKLLANPVISFFMIFMLHVELLGGGLGYLVGRFKNGKT